MPKWVQAILAVIGAAVAEYWSGAPPVMKSAFACLPVVIVLDMAATVAFGRLCEPKRPMMEGDRWQAVTLRAMLTCGFLILGITADAVSGIRYSFAPLAVLWGYSTHVASTVRHFKQISKTSHIPFPPWADELDDRADALTNAGVQPEAAAAKTTVEE